MGCGGKAMIKIELNGKPYYFRLEPIDKSDTICATLSACDANGIRIPGGFLLIIRKDGFIESCYGISCDSGLRLFGGRIKLKE